MTSEWKETGDISIATKKTVREEGARPNGRESEFQSPALACKGSKLTLTHFLECKVKMEWPGIFIALWHQKLANLAR